MPHPRLIWSSKVARYAPLNDMWWFSLLTIGYCEWRTCEAEQSHAKYRWMDGNFKCFSSSITFSRDLSFTCFTSTHLHPPVFVVRLCMRFFTPTVSTAGNSTGFGAIAPNFSHKKICKKQVSVWVNTLSCLWNGICCWHICQVLRKRPKVYRL